MRFAGSAFLFLFASQAIAGDSWPQFRGPKGDGISDSKGVPTTWSDTENIVWKTPIHDKGWSSPVIVGDQIWLTSAKENYAPNAPKENPGKKIPTPESLEMFAICVDRKTGKIIHDIPLRKQEKPDYCHSFNSYATPTPVIDGGKVYVHFGSHGTFCLDAQNGKVLWERLDLKCDHWRGPGSSPIIFENSLILTFDGHDLQYICALDKATGKDVWKKDKAIAYSTNDGDYKKAYSTPAILSVEGKPQLVSPSAEATIAFDPKSGEELWRIHHGGMNEASVPQMSHGLIFLNNGHKTEMLAVKAGGKGKLTPAAVAWKMNKGVPSRPSIITLGDHIYMVNDNGFASCVDAKTGDQVWSERQDGKYSASPVLAGGSLYLFDQDGKAKVIEAKPVYKLVATNKLGDGCMASPAVVGDSLYVRTKSHLYRIGKKD